MTSAPTLSRYTLLSLCSILAITIARPTLAQSQATAPERTRLRFAISFPS
jgi:hypothetical protein